MARYIYQRKGLNKSEGIEIKRCLKEHGIKGIEAFKQQYNVECFEDITPTIYFSEKSNKLGT